MSDQVARDLAAFYGEMCPEDQAAARSEINLVIQIGDPRDCSCCSGGPLPFGRDRHCYLCHHLPEPCRKPDRQTRLEVARDARSGRADEA